MKGVVRALSLLSLLLTLAECDEPFHTTQVREGCYYSQDGTAILRVEGKRAQFLIPSDFESTELTWISNDDGHYVRARPAFYFDDSPPRIEKNKAMSEIRLPIIESGYPIIGIPYSPEGDLAVTLGKTCPAAKSSPARK